MSEHHHNNAGLPEALLPLLPVVAVLAIYIGATWQLRHSRRRWSRWQTASFAIGVGVLAVGVSPSLFGIAHRDLRGHMVQHLLIGMFAPIGLVLGAPLTLALRTLSVTTARRVTALLRSQVLHWLSHPVTALFLNIGGMYLLYFTPLYVASQSSMTIHTLIHLHFLAAGYLFTWSLIGLDPAPRRPGMSTRVTVVFFAIAVHATLGKLMYAYLWPRGTTHDPEQIRAAAQLMYYGGDLAELLVVIVLFATWYHVRGRRLRASLPQAVSTDA